MKCVIYKKPFSSVIHQIRHMATVHFVNYQTCAVCGLSFGRRYNMLRHYRRNHPSANPPAIVGNQPNMDVKPSQPHTDTAIHGIRCKICNKRLASMGILKRHMSTMHFGSDQSCVVCGFPFKRRDNMMRHYHRYHKTASSPAIVINQPSVMIKPAQPNTETDNRGMKCKICKKLFSSVDHQIRHIATVHFGTHQPCVVCGLFFKRRDSMMRHYRRYHRTTSSPAHVINQPSVIIKAPQPNTETDNRGMQCKICNKSFSSVDHQIRHMATVQCG
jgi:uncharacterized Zn-finger protein